MRKFRKLLLVSMTVLISFVSAAQVTTGSISGTVKQTGGEALVGATITVVHKPSEKS